VGMAGGSILPVDDTTASYMEERNQALRQAQAQQFLLRRAMAAATPAKSLGIPSRWAVAGVKPQANASDRILRAMVLGAEDGWGDQPLGMSPETVNLLRQYGVFENGGSGFLHDSEALLRSFNESLLRGGSAALDLALIRAP